MPFLSDDEVKDIDEYVNSLEGNVEYYREMCAILQTQRDMAESKVKMLRAELMDCKRNEPITIKI
jgi:hypothetical protein